MRETFLERYEKKLSWLQSKKRDRSLRDLAGIDFTSNDYLALTKNPRVRVAVFSALETGLSIGSGGSRLLRGNHSVFETLESDAAAFFKSEAALYFGSGYTANLALFSTLPLRGDVILYDEYVHASMRDGMAASRADAIMAKHNCVLDVRNKIRTWRKNGGKGRVWIAVESIYSMDGDRAPLSDLFNLANEEEAFLIIDEAHATGVFGEYGRGLASFFEGQDNVIVLHTCGKALGASGALLCLNKIWRDYLINHARAFIYSTAPSPLIAVAVIESLNILKTQPELQKVLAERYIFANHLIEKISGKCGSGTHIIPILVGKNSDAVHLSERLQSAGFDIRAIRPPTVPENTARLRLSITLNVSIDEINQLITLLFQLLNEEKK